MTHDFERTTQTSFAMLRRESFARPLENNAHVVPGMYFSWDDEEADISIQFLTEPGKLATLDASISGNPRWVSFNLSLGSSELQPGDILGVTADLEGTAASLPVFIRSAVQDGHEDTVLAENLTVQPDGAVCTALHYAAAHESAASPAGFHTLVMSLPFEDFSLKINDMSVFVLSDEKLFSTRPRTLGYGAT